MNYRYEVDYKLILYALFGLGVLADLIPVFMPLLPLEIKGFCILTGTLLFGYGLVLSIEHPFQSKIQEGKSRANEAIRTRELSAAFLEHQTLLDLQSQQRMADRIVRFSASPELAIYNLRSAGLDHYIGVYFPDLAAGGGEEFFDERLDATPGDGGETVERSGKSDAPTDGTQGAEPVAGPRVFRRAPRKTTVDMGWFTPEFAKQSKFIFAGSGSGKSTFLREMIQQVVRAYPTVELVVVDPHLIRSQMEAAEQQNLPEGVRLPVWGLHSTPDDEADFIVHKPEDSLAELTRIIAATEARLDGEIPSSHPILVVVDEADAESFFMGERTSANGAALLELFRLVTNQARKAAVTMVVTAHTIKKGRTGIGMEDILQTTIVVLGDSLSDPHVKWPSTFDVVELEKRRRGLEATLDPNSARAIILRSYREGRTELAIHAFQRPGIPREVAA